MAHATAVRPSKFTVAAVAATVSHAKSWCMRRDAYGDEDDAA
jgi:hypothetical protein